MANIRKAQKFDMMVWSIDLNGNQKWIKRYVEPGKQSAVSINKLINNNYLLSSGRLFAEINPSNGELIKLYK